MIFPSQKVIFFATLALFARATEADEGDGRCDSVGNKEDRILPSVMIVILVRNKEHSLPWFFAGIERMKYPKRRISLWIRSDHNEDNSGVMLETWANKMKNSYHSIDLKVQSEPAQYPGQKSPGEWMQERVDHVMNLREEGLNAARSRWADYVLFTDADNVIYNKNTLHSLIADNKVVVAPMLNCTDAIYYSNFWGGVNDAGYYKRTKEYLELVRRELTGVYRVPMVHSTFLIDLNHRLSTRITFLPHPDFSLVRDDLVIWTQNSLYSGVPMYVDNSEFFGFMASASREEATLYTENGWFSYLKMEAAIHLEITSLPVSQILKPKFPAKSTRGFDQIYVINLERRTERRKRMENRLDELGIQAKFVRAVDGREINSTYLEGLGAMMMPDYIDRYHKRPLTMGEIGCFLSHYKLWEEMVSLGYDRVIVFEDDVRFESFFTYRLHQVMQEANTAVPDWDLIYLGRKIMFSSGEKFVQGADHLVRPYYTYWTIGYILNLKGARKLLAQKPLEKLVPIDEYLPIMFDHHPLESWKSHFSPRDLVALSAEPLLIHPTHYTGQKNYVTDTETADVYTVFAESKVEKIYETIAEAEQRYVEHIRQQTCPPHGDCDV